MADGDPAADPRPDRILTAANGFTTVRLLCIPVFVLLLVQPHDADRLSAGYLLAVLGATDWVDGQLARRLHQVSSLGKVLDPLADRLLLVTAAIATIAVGAVPLWVAAVAIAREVFVGTGFLYVAAVGGRRMDVTLLGKAATLCLMVALPLFIAGHSHAGWRRSGEDLAWVAAVPGLVLGWASAIQYVPRGRALLAAVRAERGVVR
jgi:cardiolipin synthase